MTDKLQLDEKNERIFKIFRSLIFVIFALGSVYFAHRVLFPSEYFTQSFLNMSSLKNTITNVSESDNSTTFFASTPQDFSEIKIDIELEKNSAPLKENSITLKKSFKSFFYPESPLQDSLSDFDENFLTASAESIFIISNKQRSPIDNPLTFEGLGYNWGNISSEKIDLSKYKKNKLLNIASAHPNGTILATNKDQYYLIEGGNKKKIDISNSPQVKDFKNNILVQEESLDVEENCRLKNDIIFKRKYSCMMPTEKIIQFPGKDYRFELSDIEENIKIKEINLEFKKTPNEDNLFLFLADIKSRVKARFTGEKL